MKKTIPICLLFLFTLTNLTLAQDVKQKEDHNGGFYVGFSLMGTSWSMPDIDNLDTSLGIGGGAKFGYNFGSNFGIYIPISISSFNPDQGANYQFYNFGLGGEFKFGKISSPVKPFVRASYNYLMIYSNLSSGDITINGFGPGLGGGLYIDISEDLEIELGYTHNWINVSSLMIGSDNYDAEGNIDTNQFSIGLVRHF